MKNRNSNNQIVKEVARFQIYLHNCFISFIPVFYESYSLDCMSTYYSNMTSVFRFVNKRAIYRLSIISLAHAPVHTFKPGNKIIK